MGRCVAKNGLNPLKSSSLQVETWSHERILQLRQGPARHAGGWDLTWTRCVFCLLTCKDTRLPVSNKWHAAEKSPQKSIGSFDPHCHGSDCFETVLGKFCLIGFWGRFSLCSPGLPQVFSCLSFLATRLSGTVKPIRLWRPFFVIVLNSHLENQSLFHSPFQNQGLKETRIKVLGASLGSVRCSGKTPEPNQWASSLWKKSQGPAPWCLVQCLDPVSNE